MRGAFPPTPSFVDSARRAAKGCEPRGGHLGRDSGTKPGRLRSPAGRASRDGSAGRLRPVSQLAAQLLPRQTPPGKGTDPGPRMCPHPRAAGGTGGGRGAAPLPAPHPAREAEQGTPGEGPSCQSRLGGKLCPGRAPSRQHETHPHHESPSPGGGFRSSQLAHACPRIPSAVSAGRGLLSGGSGGQCPRPRLAAEGRLYL